MKIKTVTYRKLRSGPDFSHCAIEATGEVEEGEDPTEALLRVRTFVLGKLSDEAARVPNAEEVLRQKILAALDDDEEMPF